MKKPFFLLLILIGFIIIHESTHYAINKQFGIASTFGISQESIYAHANSMQLSALSIEQQIAWQQAQAQAESVGYQLALPTLLLACLLLKEF